MGFMRRYRGRMLSYCAQGPDKYLSSESRYMISAWGDQSPEEVGWWQELVLLWSREPLDVDVIVAHGDELLCSVVRGDGDAVLENMRVIHNCVYRWEKVRCVMSAYYRDLSKGRKRKRGSGCVWWRDELCCEGEAGLNTYFRICRECE